MNDDGRSGAGVGHAGHAVATIRRDYTALLGALPGALHRGTGDGFDAGLRYLVGPGEPGDRVTRRHRKRTPPSNEVLHGVIQ